MDILLASTWRLDGLTKRARGGGVTAVAESQRPEPQYVWRHSRIEITVDRQGDQWRVISSTSGRLFGPRQTLYVALHRQAKHAAWDVMACAIRALPKRRGRYLGGPGSCSLDERSPFSGITNALDPPFICKAGMSRA